MRQPSTLMLDQFQEILWFFLCQIKSHNCMYAHKYMKNIYTCFKCRFQNPNLHQTMHVSFFNNTQTCYYKLGNIIRSQSILPSQLLQQLNACVSLRFFFKTNLTFFKPSTYLCWQKYFLSCNIIDKSVVKYKIDSNFTWLFTSDFSFVQQGSLKTTHSYDTVLFYNI